MVARTSSAEAIRVMHSRGLKPLTPYENAKAPWLCECSVCGHHFESTYDRAKQGRACPKCAQVARNKKAADFRRLDILTIQEAERRSNVILQETYQSSKVPHRFKCSICGEEFSQKFRKSEGEWVISCTNCGGAEKQRRLQPYKDKLNALLEADGGSIVEGKMTAKSSQVLIRCLRGHETRRSIEWFVDQDSICQVCNPRKSRAPRTKRIAVELDFEETAGLLQSNGWILKGPVLGVGQLAKVECAICHEQAESRLPRLLNGEKICSCRKNLKKSQLLRARLDAIARERGGAVVSDVPALTSQKVSFKCRVGHTWSAVASSIISQGTWCPKCAGNTVRTLEELEQIVSQRGGVLKSSVYRGVDGKYEFECNRGHEFSNSFKKVEAGQWCPICSRGSKSEEIARTTLEQLFGTKFSRRRPTWLRNSRGFQMELDGYNETLKLAFEYQGYQHYQEDHWGTDLKQRIADDLLKEELCRKNGVVLLQLTFEMEYASFPSEIKKQLEAANFQYSGVDFDAEIDLSKAYIREDRLEELRTLLAAKNITLLSTTWLGVGQKYKMRCETCSSVWEARGNAFFNRRSVSGCDYCSRRVPANKMDLSALKAYAAEHGGEILSTTYIRRNHTYTWRCAEGHVFEANFNNLKYREVFCPECEGRQKKLKISQQEAEALYLAHGLELIEPFTNRSRHLKVRCMNCKEESLQALNNLFEGKPACKPCEFAKKQAIAEQIMFTAGVQPLEPFVSNTAKWRCLCLTCQREITPVVVNVRRGQGACRFCGWEKTRAK